MDKVTLKTTLIKAHQETLQRLKDEYASQQSGGNLNLEDVRDADDNSTQRTDGRIFAGHWKGRFISGRSEIKVLRDLDFGHKTSVTAGAVALVNGQYYIIGIPACQLDLDGKHFVANVA